MDRVPLFLAEISSNHNRDLERCFSFIDTAARVGCAGVKFQLFRVDDLFAPEILLRSAAHRKRQKWELPLSFIPEIKTRCHERNVSFGCTPFYLKAVEYLAPYVDFLKIASYELLWTDLLRECAGAGKPIYLSTGMATLSEVARAVEVLLSAGCNELTVLHCVSAYPARSENCNLAVIDTMRRAFGCSVGWSDHTVNPGVIFRAVHRWGAEAVEFHLDLDGHGEEFAAGHCWLPDQIAQVITAVASGIRADGTGEKEPADTEAKERLWRADPSDGLRPTLPVRQDWRR